MIATIQAGAPTTVLIGGIHDNTVVEAASSYVTVIATGEVYDLLPLNNGTEERGFYVLRQNQGKDWRPTALDRWESGVLKDRLTYRPTPQENLEQIKRLAADLYGAHIKLTVASQSRSPSSRDASADHQVSILEADLKRLSTELVQLGAVFTTGHTAMGESTPLVSIVTKMSKLEVIPYESGRFSRMNS